MLSNVKFLLICDEVHLRTDPHTDGYLAGKNDDSYCFIPGNLRREDRLEYAIGWLKGTAELRLERLVKASNHG